MNKINMKTRLYLTLIGVNLNFLALFFFIIGLLKLYGESSDSLIAEIFTVLIGSLMIFVGLKSFNRNNPKKTVR